MSLATSCEGVAKLRVAGMACKECTRRPNLECGGLTPLCAALEYSKMCRYLELVFQQPVYGSLGNKQPDFQGAMLEPSM